MAKLVFAGDLVDFDAKAEKSELQALTQRVAALEARLAVLETAPLPAAGVVGQNGVTGLWAGTKAQLAALPGMETGTVYLETN